MDPVVCCAWIDAKLANINTATTHQQRAKRHFTEWTISFRLFVDIRFVIKPSPSLVAFHSVSSENHAEYVCLLTRWQFHTGAAGCLLLTHPSNGSSSCLVNSK